MVALAAPRAGQSADEIDQEVDRQKAFVHPSLFLPDERWAHQVKAQVMGFGFVDLRRVFVDPSDIALVDPFLAQ